MDDEIKFEDVSVKFKNKIALDSMTFTVKRGEFLGIIGPNGSGKSTLLKCLLGLVSLETGKITVFGMSLEKNLRSIRQMIGYLPQKESINTKMPLLVEDIVLMGFYGRIGLFRDPGKVHRKLTAEALKCVGMYNLRKEPLGHLSGGQQQRVFIARAIVHRPSILLLDEPTTALDVQSQNSIMELIGKLHKKLKATVFTVTHDINTISPYCDRIMYLKNKLIAIGKTNEICTHEILREVYKSDVRIFRFNGQPCVVVSDHHA